MDVDLVIELLARKAVEAMSDSLKAGKATDFVVAREKQIESGVLNDLRKEIQDLVAESRGPARKPAKPITTVTLPAEPFGSGYDFSLDSSLKPGDIDKILAKFSGIPGKMFRVADDPNKVRFSWRFMVDGKKCAIWDYNRTRWSAYGPKECFQAIGLKVVG